MKRRSALAALPAGWGAVIGLAELSGAACQGSQAAAQPTETPEPRPTASPYQVQVQIRPQDARLGQDEFVVIQARVLYQGRPVSGAALSAVAHYPSATQEFTAQMTTFQDGRVDLQVPVSPPGSGVTRGSNVRLEVVMRYQGQEVRQNAGFNVR